MFVHRMSSQTVDAAADDVYDYFVSGATGPDHVLAALSPRQRDWSRHAAGTTLHVLGARYRITLLEPVRRIDFRTHSTLLPYRGMILVTATRDGRGTDLTLYLAKDHAGLLTSIYEHHFARITRRLEQLPDLTSHPSWPWR